MARLLARNGAAVIAAAISPYAATREEVRREVEATGAPFLEVYVSAPVEALAARDVKGLYRKALAGETAQFHGRLRPVRGPALARARGAHGHGDRGGVRRDDLALLRERGLLRPLRAEARAS